ncbi:phosphopantothenoylcysteine decarboxylase [Candidatus Latescibacterota bacterium]
MEHKASNRVLVTSGPTREYVDSIRYFSNTSTGALGSKIVEALINRDISVIHIYGLGSETPKGCNSQLLESVEVTTVDDLIHAIKDVADSGNIHAVVHAMAVLDYVPEARLTTKKKSDEDFWNIRLVRAPKVIWIMRKLMPDAFFTAFKLEAGVTEEELVEKAGVLLNTYLLDIVIANDIDRVNEKYHEALFIGRENQILDRTFTKKEIAKKLADYIIMNCEL